MIKQNRNRIIIKIGLFTALTAIGAYVKIPLPHVPVTLQTFFVIMAGNLLGYRFGSISQVLYLVLGLMGLPIFAYGGGPGYIFQPTFGYLVGYPIAAFSIGLILKRSDYYSSTGTKQSVPLALTILLADLVGVLIIFLLGLSYLFLNIKYSLYLNISSAAFAGLNFEHAITTVIFIFLPFDCLKVILATWVTLKLKRRFAAFVS